MSVEPGMLFEDPADRAGFTKIPNVVLLDPRLTAGGLRLYALMRFFARQRAECHPGKERLAELLGKTERTVYAWVIELVELDLLLVRHRGLGRTNQYVIRSLAGRELPAGSEAYFRSDGKQTAGEVDVVEEDGDEVEGDGSLSLSVEQPSAHPARDVFEHWRLRMGKNGATKLTPERRRSVEARLRDGYAIERIKRAVDGCAGSDFHMGRHEKTRGRPQNDLTLICRNGSKLEAFEAMPPPGGSSGGKYDRIVN